jgi:hypothetical protein
MIVWELPQGYEGRGSAGGLVRKPGAAPAGRPTSVVPETDQCPAGGLAHSPALPTSETGTS